jgi:hypothetical protein
MADKIVIVEVGMDGNGDPLVTKPLDPAQVKAFAEASAAIKTGASAGPTTATDKTNDGKNGGSSRGGKSRKGRKSLRRR